MPKMLKKMENVFMPGSRIGVQPFLFDRHHKLIEATKGIELGKGIWVGCNSVILNGYERPTALGNYVKVSSLTKIGHDSIIGAYTRIASGVMIAGYVEIGKRSFIGQGVKIKERLKVGNCTIIGQGANVLKDVPDNVIAFGNPCKVISKRFKPMAYYLRRFAP